MSDKPTVSTDRSKPPKPFAGFPLFAHGSGQWARKINKRLFYFGVWRDPDAALARHNFELPYLKDGRTPPPFNPAGGPTPADVCTIRRLCNAFLQSKENLVNSEELSPRTFRDYYRICKMLVDHFGKERRVDELQPADFEDLRKTLAKRLGVVSLGNAINGCRIVFNYAVESQLVKSKVSIGPSFRRPQRKVLRRDRRLAGPKMFQRDEVLRLLDAADVQLRAMIFLGLNAGFGNTDVASLPQSAIDLAKRWIDFPRPKTEEPRRIPIWPETVEAIQAAIAARPAAKESTDADLVFLTRTGHPWVRIQKRKKKVADQGDGPEILIPLDAISGRFGKLLKRLKINGRRGLGFYSLRHTFETIGGESKDQVAVNSIMGHIDSSMAGVYREKISDARLKAVVDVVRTWLYAPSPASEIVG